jgi:hypothetical protein
MLCGGSPLAINHPRRTASITAASASKFPRLEALAIGASNRYCSGWSPEARTSSAHNARVRESAAILVRCFAMLVNGLPWAGVARQHPGMAKKSAPKKATSIKVTATMKRAGAEAIKGASELYPNELVERIYRAMAAADKRGSRPPQ